MTCLKLILVCVIVVACMMQTALAFWSPAAYINGSRIVGKTYNFIGVPFDAYLGIPFAEPPVAELRFQKPIPIRNYPEVFNATQAGRACMQFSLTYGADPWVVPYDHGKARSEDCLYLNIYAPVGANQWNKKAVLFWVHGGDHRAGSGYYSWNYPYTLATLGNIIVVTVNYRLDYFGFFTSNTPDAPGNIGVWDILESLRWVNQYISAFGGDASRITIGGQGTGALDVGLLTISPLSQGLYHRQIMQSGSPAWRRADNNTQDIAYSQELADLLCQNRNATLYSSPKEKVDCLKHPAYASTIEYYGNDVFAKKTSYGLEPQFGDEILPENPRISVINNNFRCTDLLIGTVKDEGAYSMTNFEYRFDRYDFQTADPSVNRSVAESIIRKTVSYFPDPEAIVDHYLPPTLQDDTDHRLRHQTYTAYGDTVHACPTVYYAEKCAEQKKNVYFYHFDHQPSKSLWIYNQRQTKWIHSGTHMDEIPFMFGYPINEKNKYTPAERILSSQVINIWSNFVKYGKPSVPWPLFSKESPAFKYIGSKYVTGANGRGPHSENCEFLRPHFGF